MRVGLSHSFFLGGETLKVKALVSFSGQVTMAIGEVKEIKDKATCKDLLQAGYVEEVKPTKKVNADEN
jgi:hypothetical protein